MESFTKNLQKLLFYILIYFLKYETISTFATTFWTHIISELGGVLCITSFTYSLHFKTGFVFLSFLNELRQGCRKLHKAGWVSIAVSKGTICPILVEIGLTDLSKAGWAIACPAHPSPIPL